MITKLVNEQEDWCVQNGVSQTQSRETSLLQQSLVDYQSEYKRIIIIIERMTPALVIRLLGRKVNECIA